MKETQERHICRAPRQLQPPVSHSIAGQNSHDSHPYPSGFPEAPANNSYLIAYPDACPSGFLFGSSARSKPLASVVQAFFTTPKASRNTSPLFPTSNPNSGNSSGRSPLATPRRNLPLLIWSTVVACFAKMRGCANGSAMAAVPSATRDVETSATSRDWTQSSGRTGAAKGCRSWHVHFHEVTAPARPGCPASPPPGRSRAPSPNPHQTAR